MKWLVESGLPATQPAPCNCSATFDECDGETSGQEKLPVHLKFDIHVQSHGETSLPSNLRLSGRKQAATKMQSAYRRYHSTETAVSKILSDILCASDRGDVTFLCLLDLCATFDTVDHDILVDRLERAFGLRGLVLEWDKSLLFKRTQSVLLNGSRSTQSELQCGVPQGSVPGQILFLLYTADVMQIADRHGLSARSYLDDTQLKFHEKADQCLQRLPSLEVFDNEISE